MAGSGLAPNPNSRRQQTVGQSQTWTDLPADGYQGEIPAWPLLTASERELMVWASVWRTPQAAAWHGNGWLHDVALYVRFVIQGEDDLDAAKEARMWSDRLGLNPVAMLKNRWRVRPDEVADKRTMKTTVKTKARRRLKVADDALARP